MVRLLYNTRIFVAVLLPFVLILFMAHTAVKKMFFLQSYTRVGMRNGPGVRSLQEERLRIRNSDIKYAVDKPAGDAKGLAGKSFITYGDFHIKYSVLKPRNYSGVIGKRFAYLVNADTKKGQIKGLSENKERDVIWMTFADKSGDIYAPYSTICAGRNALVHYAVSLAAQMSDGGYEYYVIMDDDLKLSVRSDGNLNWKPWSKMATDPYKRFEEYLMHYRPIVGYVRYMEMERQYVNKKRPVNLNWDYDECINAFHRDTLSFLVPFDTVLDSESWWYCTWMTRQLISMLYHSYRYQCNSLHVDNLVHARKGSPTKYKQIQDFKVPRDMISSALRKSTDDNPNAPNPFLAAVLKGTSSSKSPRDMQPGPRVHVPGKPKRKFNHSYLMTPDFIRKYWDDDHPMIKKRLAWLAKPEVRKVLQMDSPNLPPFVPDTMYCPAPRQFSLKST